MRNYHQLLFLVITLMAATGGQGSNIENDHPIKAAEIRQLYTLSDAQDFAVMQEQIKKDLFNDDQYKRYITARIADRYPDYFGEGIAREGGKIAINFHFLENLITGLEGTKVGLHYNMRERPEDKISRNNLASIVVSLMSLKREKDALIAVASQALTPQLFLNNLKDYPDNRFNTSTDEGQRRVLAILSDMYGIEDE